MTISNEPLTTLTTIRPELGVCQWFHFGDEFAVRRAVALLRELGVRHLRTGVSWADFHRSGGSQWYARMFELLAEFDLLISVWHTPPSISENGECNGPPRRLEDYADFVMYLEQLYGRSWWAIELWNEPNNRLKWDFEHSDPSWMKFGQMVGEAAKALRDTGKIVVLGGMIPVDPAWLGLMENYGALEYVDVLAIHGFPHMWWHGPICWDWERDWRGWSEKARKIRGLANGRAIWITETGLSTWDMTTHRHGRYELQTQMLNDAAVAPVDRVYWYSLIDLHPARDAIEGFHIDENEYHLGLVTSEGIRKPAYWQFAGLMADRASDSESVMEGTVL